METILSHLWAQPKNEAKIASALRRVPGADAPQTRDELEHTLRAHRTLEVTDLEVGVLDDEPGENGLIVLERSCRRVTGVAEVQEVAADLLAEWLLLPASVAHRLFDDARSFS